MNVLFLTMNIFTDIEMHNIYSDLMKEFIKHGHRPYIVTPREKKMAECTELVDYEDYSLLKVQIGNTSNVSLIEKGVSTVMLASLFYRAVKRELGHLKFGLILYSTPPITLAKPVKKLKKLFKCKTYLMLKDIFPQNAVDLKMLSKNGLIYKYFRLQEKELYKESDYIGCMSQANVDYVLRNNPNIVSEKVHVNPNSIEVRENIFLDEKKAKIRAQYNIPENATTFIYGGNLGRPQGISFIIECLKANADKSDRFFIICGKGTEYIKLESFVNEYNPKNILLLNELPKAEYEEFVKAFDVGLVFLDHRFTIPNFPSRILSYMENGMPVLACTDPCTDIGQVITEGNFGLWCESDAASKFSDCVDKMLLCDLDEFGHNSRKFLIENYSVERCYSIISGKVKI